MDKIGTNRIKGFTILDSLLSMVLLSISFVMAFSLLNSIGYSKRTIQKTKAMICVENVLKSIAYSKMITENPESEKDVNFNIAVDIKDYCDNGRVKHINVSAVSYDGVLLYESNQCIYLP